uniref:ARAD1C45606p n=1 Tax=Blastobotrys adeninivorans TaxID=409370 RepID=A0A060TAG1_BLAAD
MIVSLLSQIARVVALTVVPVVPPEQTPDQTLQLLQHPSYITEYLGTPADAWVNGSSGVVKAPLELYNASGGNYSRLRRRNYEGGSAIGFDTFIEPLANQLTFYTVNVTLGSPRQQVSVLVDTGSSDLWVPDCGQGSMNSNGFDLLQSRSWMFGHQDEEFSIKYVKGYAKGLWGRDDLRFLAGPAIRHQRFAVATESSEISMGVLGIGPVNAESTQQLYDNVPMSLVRQGHIAKNIYSIYLDDWDSANGCILFGGIDLAKFHPPLHTVPLTSTISLRVVLSSIQADGRSALDEPIAAALDTGTTLMYLPPDCVNRIANLLGARYDPDLDLHRLPRSHFSEVPKYLTFSFMGATIKVPSRELFWPTSWFVESDEPDLSLTIMSNKKSLGYNILGDTFLRSAYVVYDLDYRQVSLAQARNSHGHEEILAISESVPGTRASSGD